jgi:putative transposase
LPDLTYLVAVPDNRRGCTRECVVIEADALITGSRVKAILERLADLRGLPRSMTVDHGREFEG